jgi:hypothetical protein
LRYDALRIPMAGRRNPHFLPELAGGFAQNVENVIGHFDSQGSHGVAPEFG